MIWAECSKAVPNAAGGGRGRVEMHSDAGGVRRAGGRLPAGVQQNSASTKSCLRSSCNINVCEKTYVDLLYLRHVYNLVTAIIKMG
jgi:hypothetical protein